MSSPVDQFIAHRRGALASQGGWTLLEALVTVMVMSLLAVGLAASLAVMLRSTTLHSRLVRSGLLATDAAEYLDRQPFKSTCSSATAIATYQANLNSQTWGNYTLKVTGVQFLQNRNANPEVFVASCGSTDQGAQRITIRATPNGLTVGESVNLVKRDRTCPSNVSGRC
ncbi:MAG: type II secretion system protein [Microthrixaceae bacterium]